MQRLYFPELIVGRERIAACLVVIVGFLIGSYGDINFNWIGVILCYVISCIGLYSGIVSSVLVAYYNTLIKKALARVNGNTW